MIDFNYERFGQAAIERGVWIAQDKREGGYCGCIRGFLPSEADARLVASYLERKGFFTEIQMHPMNPHTGAPCISESDDSYAKLAKQGELVLLAHVAIFKKDKGWIEKDPYENVLPYKEDEICDKAMDGEKAAGKEMTPEKQALQQAILNLIKRHNLNKNIW